MKTPDERPYLILEDVKALDFERLPGKMPIIKLVEKLREEKDDPFKAALAQDLTVVMSRGFTYIANGRLPDSTMFFLLYEADPVQYHLPKAKPGTTIINPKLTSKNENRPAPSRGRNALVASANASV